MKSIILSNYEKNIYIVHTKVYEDREKSIEKDLHPNVTVVITEAWDLR